MKNISSLVKSYRTERHTKIKRERKEAFKKTLGLLKVFGAAGGDFSYGDTTFGERSLIQTMEDIVNEDE